MEKASDRAPALMRTTVQYRFVVFVARTLLTAFFRRVEVAGLEHLPRSGGGIVVSWHPNGLIDPSLIITRFPGQVVFGARHGLFRVPVLGWLMRGLGTVPVYRAADMPGGASDEARRAANQRSLDALAERVARGSFSALFPEGVSHDAPHLRELRRGVARLYYRARQLALSDAPPVIIPVGVHYDEKHAFRSNALVQFYPPLKLPPDLDVTPDEDEDEVSGVARQTALTTLINDDLHEVIGATEDWYVHHLIQRVRKLFRAERAARAHSRLEKPLMRERALGFARVRKAYNLRAQTHPEETQKLRRRLQEYDADLQVLGLDDHELDRDPRLASPWLGALVALQLVLVFLLLPPILLVGYLINLPTAALLMLACRRMARDVKDEATIKLLGGALLFPATWVAAGLAVASGFDWLAVTFPNYPATPIAAGVTTGLLGALGGAVALRYLRLARQTMRAARVRLTRRKRRTAITRLRQERSAIFDSMKTLVGDAALPGIVTSDGRIVD